MTFWQRLLIVASVTALTSGCGGDVEHRSYDLAWTTVNVPASVQRGASFPVTVTVRNTGDWAWPDRKTANPSHPTGEYAIRLSYRWWKDGQSKPEVDYVDRADLAQSIPPGGSATFNIKVVAPAAPGTYRIQFDLVQELIAWFGDRGASKSILPVRVE